MDFVEKKYKFKRRKSTENTKKYILWKQSISEIITLISKEQEI